MLKFAEYDRKYIFREPPNAIGHYQCYCKEYHAVYEVLQDQKHLCYEYFSGKYYSQLSKYALSFIIVFANLVVRNLNIYLVNKIGYKTRSRTVGGITLFVFMA